MTENINSNEKDYHKKVWPVGGGKGGVGKSFITANLGLAIANQLDSQKSEVLLFDADLGSGNLHNFLGIRNRTYTLKDFLSKKKKTLNEITIESPLENLKLISGGNEILNLVNPNFQQKVRLFNSLKHMKVDYVLMDLAPTSHYNTIDFFSLSNDGIIVTTPEPPAIHNSYGFLKNIIYRKLWRFFRNNTLVLQIFDYVIKGNGQHNITSVNQFIEKIKDIDEDLAEKALKLTTDFHPQLILNMVEKSKDLLIIKRFQSVVKKYLNISVQYLGHIPFARKVRKSSRLMSPVLLEFPHSKVSRCLHNIAKNLLAKQPQRVIS